MPKEIYLDFVAADGCSDTQVRVKGRGEPNRELLVCFTDGTQMARCKTNATGWFDVLCAPGHVHGFFVARHFETNGTMGDNKGWSNAMMNPFSPNFR
ncbi:hypothetical protein G3435_25670 [Pseudomonas sp. MAFF212428]|uniref:Uncharacterized protein n=1 Tax=Pseudomonas brassicae TaxID=2708063 RepID=A0A6B3NUT0_9PSED|nr:hypothetical protein [Pseudomonas brassicae]NER62413.1 hypothetical protein [Pseudomonas brassicae]NER64168.1 hypothetical protein [Pseudomonas brassicae]